MSAYARLYAGAQVDDAALEQRQGLLEAPARRD